MYGRSGSGIPDTIFLFRGHQEGRLLTYYSISGLNVSLHVRIDCEFSDR